MSLAMPAFMPAGCGRRVTLTAAICALCLILAPVMTAKPARAQGPWQGVWDTTYGVVHLRQDGRRVWGDYLNTSGVIEARTTADGNTLRGTFLRGDDRWGWVSFTLSGTGWRGNWRWNDIPEASDTGWHARTRRSAGPPLLRHATGPGPFWPPTFAGRPTGRYATFAFGPGGQDPYPGGNLGPPPLPPEAATAHNIWYGAYDSNLISSGYMVSVAVDDTNGPNGALVDLSFFAPTVTVQEATARCPADMHPAFCAEIYSRFSAGRGTRASMQVTLMGTLVDERQVQVAFLLDGDVAPRLLSLWREGRGGADQQVRLSVWHPQRGLDLDAMTLALEHPCRGGTCDPLRGSAVERLPGPLASVDFVNAYRQLPDDRAAAHRQGATPGPLPAPAPPRNTMPVRIVDGTYEIVDQHDTSLGTVTLTQGVGGAVTGTGSLILTPALAGQSAREVRIGTYRVSPEALDLGLVHGVGGQAPRLLISPRDDGAWIGTLVRGDVWELVTLHPADALFDLPGVGVYGPNYRLRNTGGNAALLREAPRASAAAVGSLPAQISALYVLQCLPEVDSLAWELAGQNARLQMLDTVWCEVRHDRQLPGWIPGYFLDPLAQ